MPRPDVSTASRRQAVQIEDSIRHDALETGVLIAPNGSVLSRRQGLADQVWLLPAELALASDATYTHNHPGGTGPSLEDALIAAQHAMRELRVVTSTHRYGIKRLPSGLMIPLQANFQQVEQAAIADVRDDIQKGKLRPSDLRPVARHRTWLRLCNLFGSQLNYWSEQS